MRAWVIDKTDAGQAAALRDFPDADMMEGAVTVRISHSGLNYKDGLALTGKAPVVRRFPMIPGIDFAGTVEHSDSPDFHPGDAVLLNGWGTGETHLGGYAERSRVPAEWLIPLPPGLTPARAMAIGTAGYTAMLSLMALEAHGLRPAHGPAVVTGAAGGVGSVAIALLASAGWHVIASTGRMAEEDYLRGLGAAEVVDRATLGGTPRPLAKERWAAGVDSVGSATLANVLSMTRTGGAVAACGLAGGADLPGSVMPFILRGIALLGVDSVMAPRAKRIEAWGRLAKDLDLDSLDRMTTTIGLDAVQDAAARIIAGQIRGRTVVEVG